ncbi:hypothetical protein [Burkholderia pseudomultivorans]|uniref:hypothetical protein n=1 Tax=Burkholderia pseudomultivorans TaxID=1207504 RepID=UPI000AC05854|nr:hypothetical protein [Burkholderia pseudomultivorans]
MSRQMEHGMIGTPTYRSWDCMKQRCLNPKNKKFAIYGARGITVCERWLRFEAFLEDMGIRVAGTTLDRFPDSLGNYEPGNCRWATPMEQSLNRKSVIMVEHQGVTKAVGHWCDELGLGRSSVYLRIRNGADPLVALGILPANKREGAC